MNKKPRQDERELENLIEFIKNNKSKYLLDYTTIYRAVLSGVNSSPVESIDYVKKKLMVNEK